MGFRPALAQRGAARGVDEVRDVALLEVEVAVAGDAEHAGDDGLELEDALADAGGEVGGAGLPGGLADEELGEALDGVEGVADLVGDAAGHGAEGGRLVEAVHALLGADEDALVLDDLDGAADLTSPRCTAQSKRWARTRVTPSAQRTSIGLTGGVAGPRGRSTGWRRGSRSRRRRGARGRRWLAAWT